MQGCVGKGIRRKNLSNQISESWFTVATPDERWSRTSSNFFHVGSKNDVFFLLKGLILETKDFDVAYKQLDAKMAAFRNRLEAAEVPQDDIFALQSQSLEIHVSSLHQTVSEGFAPLPQASVQWSDLLRRAPPSQLFRFGLCKIRLHQKKW